MADLLRLSTLADPRVRLIWDEKTTQLATRLEYQNLGYTDYMAEIRDTQLESYSGLGLAAQTAEGAPYHKEDINQFNNLTLSPLKFTQAIEITEEMYRFNLWPRINNLVDAAAASLYGRIDTQAAKLFYLGAGTTFFTGSDGSSLFNTAHTMGDGSTQSNSTTNTLSYANLKTAAQVIDRFYDDKGQQMLPCRNLRLIVARENFENAKEILRSIGDPTNANRVSNIYANGQGSIDLKVSYYIPLTTYSKYWFLIDLERAEKLHLKMIWGWKPRFDDDKIINSGKRIYAGSTSLIPGVAGWQFAYGSQATT